MKKFLFILLSWVVISELPAKNYITRRLEYEPLLLSDKQRVRGVYSIQIDSYGEVYEAKVLQSCGIENWDNQVLEIIREMPRWTPTIYYATTDLIISVKDFSASWMKTD
ncbi:MAG: energy transducer TonB [Odoribacter splanchnicus]|mgnify:CR=1 FL=1|jgi:hypothetical protein